MPRCKSPAELGLRRAVPEGITYTYDEYCRWHELRVRLHSCMHAGEPEMPAVVHLVYARHLTAGVSLNKGHALAPGTFKTQQNHRRGEDSRNGDLRHTAAWPRSSVQTRKLVSEKQNVLDEFRQLHSPIASEWSDQTTLTVFESCFEVKF